MYSEFHIKIRYLIRAYQILTTWIQKILHRISLNRVNLFHLCPQNGGRQTQDKKLKIILKITLKILKNRVVDAKNGKWDFLYNGSSPYGDSAEISTKNDTDNLPKIAFTENPVNRKPLIRIWRVWFSSNPIFSEVNLRRNNSSPLKERRQGLETDPEFSKTVKSQTPWKLRGWHRTFKPPFTRYICHK